jgi:hypothetical protein
MRSQIIKDKAMENSNHTDLLLQFQLHDQLLLDYLEARREDRKALRQKRKVEKESDKETLENRRKAS